MENVQVVSTRVHIQSNKLIILDIPGLNQIVDVDKRNGIVTLKLWLFDYYRLDDALWNPSDYDNVTRMQFPADTFWKPDIG